MAVNISSTETVVKIVAVVVVALWACVGATRLLYPGVWKWIIDKISWCFFVLCKPCRNLYNRNKSPDTNFVGLRQHYVLSANVRDNDSFSKSFSDAKPRKSEGSLKNPRHNRGLSNCSTGVVTNHSRSPGTTDAEGFLERNGGSPRQGRRRARGRGGRGRGRGRGECSFTHDTDRARTSEFDIENPLQESVQDNPLLDSECDIESGEGNLIVEEGSASVPLSLVDA